MRLKRLEEYVRLLDGLRGRDFTDPYLRGALERYLQLSAECSLDIGEMVIATEGLAKPETHPEVILRLTQANILPTELGKQFEGIASLRNILVHDHSRVDIARLQGFLGRLDDFRDFARHIVTWAQNREKTG